MSDNDADNVGLTTSENDIGDKRIQKFYFLYSEFFIKDTNVCYKFYHIAIQIRSSHLRFYGPKLKVLFCILKYVSLI